MSSPAQPQSPHPRAVVMVGPSLMVKLAVAPMSKILNPLIAKLAGRRHFPVALIHHVGRRSGKHYITPVGAGVTGDIALVPLTFGTTSDWARNVVAAGQCWIRLDGRSYHTARPQFIDAAQARTLLRAAFNPLQRIGFGLLGIKHYLRLQVSA
jgi:deazaflavin-dependent oxidoreductase (nitroreductase family)